jgi:type IV pilus assembly protein PilE
VRTAGARGTGGFTLIELLVAVAIVAILAAIAVPSYQAYVVRGKRAAAKAGLLQVAQAMERYYTANGSYLNAGAIPLAAIAGTATCVAQAPADGAAPTYCISGAPTASGGFLLSATPCGNGALCTATANNTFTDAACNVLTLDNTGIKGITGTATVNECWQR